MQQQTATSQALPMRKKYESCKNFKEKGVCKYGDRCLFAHGDHELTRRSSPKEEKTEDKKVEDIKEGEQTTMDSTKIIDITPVSALKNEGKKLSFESDNASN